MKGLPSPTFLRQVPGWHVCMSQPIPRQRRKSCSSPGCAKQKHDNAFGRFMHISMWCKQPEEWRSNWLVRVSRYLSVGCVHLLKRVQGLCRPLPAEFHGSCHLHSVAELRYKCLGLFSGSFSCRVRACAQRPVPWLRVLPVCLLRGAVRQDTAVHAACD